MADFFGLVEVVVEETLIFDFGVETSIGALPVSSFNTGSAATLSPPCTTLASLASTLIEELLSLANNSLPLI